MGRFKGIGSKRQSGGGNWWKAGKYRAKIAKIVMIEDGHTGDSYVIEAECLETINGECKPGETYSQVIKLDKPSAEGNIASFLRACSAIMTEENLDDFERCEIDESDVEASYSEDQPLVGVELTVTAVDIVTRAGKPFTKIMYAP